MPTRSKKSSPSRNREPQHDEEYFADLVYKHAGRTRYTQDSPILADVFDHYALKSDDDVQLDFGRQNDDDFRLDLLITPHQSRTAQQLANELRDRLEREKIASLEKNGESEDAPPGEAAPFNIAANQSCRDPPDVRGIAALRLAAKFLVENATHRGRRAHSREGVPGPGVEAVDV